MTTNGTVRNTKYALLLLERGKSKNTEISVPNCSGAGDGAGEAPVSVLERAFEQDLECSDRVCWRVRTGVWVLTRPDDGCPWSEANRLPPFSAQVIEAILSLVEAKQPGGVAAVQWMVPGRYGVGPHFMDRVALVLPLLHGRQAATAPPIEERRTPLGGRFISGGQPPRRRPSLPAPSCAP